MSEDLISRDAVLDACSQSINILDAMSRIEDLPPVAPKQRWIPVSDRLPELNKPLLVTAYHRVCYAHMISESGNYGYPVFRLHEIKDSDRGWVQETISHEPYSKGRIDAWMYIDIPEPYKVEPQEKLCADCNHYGKLSLVCGRCDDDCSMYEPQESEETK